MAVRLLARLLLAFVLWLDHARDVDVNGLLGASSCLDQAENKTLNCSNMAGSGEGQASGSGASLSETQADKLSDTGSGSGSSRRRNLPATPSSAGRDDCQRTDQILFPFSSLYLSGEASNISKTAKNLNPDVINKAILTLKINKTVQVFNTTPETGSCVRFQACYQSLSNLSNIFEKSIQLVNRVRQCMQLTLEQVYNDCKYCAQGSDHNSTFSPTNVRCGNTTCNERRRWREPCYAVKGLLRFFNVSDLITDIPSITAGSKVSQIVSSLAKFTSEYHYLSQIQEGAKSILVTYQNRSHCDLNMSLEVLISKTAAFKDDVFSSVMTLAVLQRLNAFGQVMAWGYRRSSYFDAAISKGSETPMFSKGKNETNELLQELCLQMHPCHKFERNRSSSSLSVCRRAGLALNDFNRIAAHDTSACFTSIVGLLCGDRNKTGSKSIDKRVESNGCSEYHPSLLSCPHPRFISSSLKGPFFSPATHYYSYVHTAFKQMNISLAKPASLPTCRLRCISEVAGASKNLFLLCRIVNAFLVTIFFAVALFGAVLVSFNRERMLENPRRSFLYLNVISVLSRVGLVGVFFRDASLCNSDGSFIINKDANYVCLASALIREVEILATPLSLLWVSYIWHRTLVKLAGIQRVELDPLWKERTFFCTFVVLPLLSATYHFFSSDQIVESYPLVSRCVFYSTDLALYVRSGTLTFSRLILILSACCFWRAARFLKKLKKQAEKFRPLPALDMWMRRHRFIFSAAILYLLITVQMIVVATIGTNFHNAGQNDYHQSHFLRLGRCLAHKGCRENISCTVPGRKPILQQQIFVQQGLNNGWLAIISFAWILGREIKWPVFKSVKRWIDLRQNFGPF